MAKTIKKWAIVLISIVVLFFIYRQYKQAARIDKIRQILYETDHKALLVCCRALLAQKEQGKWPEDDYVKVDVEYAKLPKEILALRPDHVLFNPNYISLQMLRDNGPVVFLVAYKDGYKDDENYGIELIEGLRYYGEELGNEDGKQVMPE